MIFLSIMYVNYIRLKSMMITSSGEMSKFYRCDQQLAAKDGNKSRSPRRPENLENENGHGKSHRTLKFGKKKCDQSWNFTKFVLFLLTFRNLALV